MVAGHQTKVGITNVCVILPYVQEVLAKLEI